MKKNTEEKAFKEYEHWWKKLFRRKKTMIEKDAKSMLDVVKKIRKKSGFRINN